MTSFGARLYAPPFSQRNGTSKCHISFEVSIKEKGKSSFQTFCSSQSKSNPTSFIISGISPLFTLSQLTKSLTKPENTFSSRLCVSDSVNSLYSCHLVLDLENYPLDNQQE